MRVSELVKELKGTEHLLVNKALKWVAITRDTEDKVKTLRVFKLLDNDEVEEIPFKEVREQLITVIMSQIDTAKLAELVLTESINTTVPEELFDLIDRILHKKAKVKPSKGCVELNIGGKPGRHLRYRLM